MSENIYLDISGFDSEDAFSEDDIGYYKAPQGRGISYAPGQSKRPLYKISVVLQGLQTHLEELGMSDCYVAVQHRVRLLYRSLSADVAPDDKVQNIFQHLNRRHLIPNQGVSRIHFFLCRTPNGVGVLNKRLTLEEENVRAGCVLFLTSRVPGSRGLQPKGPTGASKSDPVKGTILSYSTRATNYIGGRRTKFHSIRTHN